jgi:hypothetical protein
MKKGLVILMALLLVYSSTIALAESTPGGTPPDKPEGQGGFSDKPPAGSGGEPSGTNGDMPAGIPGDMPGGQSAQPSEYTAVYTYYESAELNDSVIESTGTDENAVLVTGGDVSANHVTVTRQSSDSSGGDSASFYGVGAAMLATGGTLTIANSAITTDSSGGAGVFAYGDGIVYVSDTAITTSQGTSGGIHVAGGGTLYARNLVVETSGGSSAAIRSDRGGGTMVVDGGSYTSNGSGSPALYCTADIAVNDATLTATGAEALCLEGLNSVRLFDTDLIGDMPDSEQNDNTWNVILYQSMSGDAQAGKGTFEMTGGTLTSKNGGMFYTTNTESEFILNGVEIIPSQDNDYFLRCTGNSNQRGWGTAGANGADCTFTAIAQTMNGDVIWDSISQLAMYLTSGSTLIGAVTDDETNAGNGGSGYCSLYIDAASSWTVTGDSELTNLYTGGSIADLDGNTVSIIDTDGTVYVRGTSAYTITVSTYDNQCDVSGAGNVSSWSEYAVSFE